MDFNRFNGINNVRGFEEQYYKNGQFNRFNLNDIDKINLNHPFKILISYIIIKNEKDIKNINNLKITFEFDYFKLLDNFNRYNIAFELSFHLVIEDKLFLYKSDEVYFIILKKEKNRLPVDSVYFICLSDIDKGEKELTKLEKWKREVIKNKEKLKDQLSLINPYVYNTINLFYKSKDKKNHLSIDFYFSNEGRNFIFEHNFDKNYFLDAIDHYPIINPDFLSESLNPYPTQDPDFLLSILENFDLKKLDKIIYYHPFRYLIDQFYFFNEMYMSNYENIDVLVDDYFKRLNNYYRYGIVFNSKNMHQGNKLLLKFHIWGYHIEADLKVINYSPHGLEIINLDEIDNGEIELSKIEKWKRKIVIEKKSVKDKLILLAPYIYNNFSIFYHLSHKDNIKKYQYLLDIYFKRREHNIGDLNKFKKNNYKEKRICEDKIFEKYKEILK